MSEEKNRIRLEREINSFNNALTDYGSSDIYTAIEAFNAVGLSGIDLADQIREFSEDTETPLNKIDPCYIAYDHILQMARNKINEVLDFDFVNDIHGGTEFYTYGNYMATSYDYSTEAQEQLRAQLKEATQEEIDQLQEDPFVKFFLNCVDVEIKPKKKVKA